MSAILTTKQAAEYCGISVQHLYNLLSTNEGPASYKHGSRNAFYAVDLDEWLRNRLVQAQRV